MSTEWDAISYHQVAQPQTEWGHRVLARLDLDGGERAIDAGCGSGRLTAALLTRLPRGRMVAIDRSWTMLLTARANLRPAFGSRVAFVRVELPAMPFARWSDLVFSTATFHWVRDHQSLFDNVFQSLRPGGRLVAQCGGGPNLARARAFATAVMQRDPFAPFFRDWLPPWEYALPGETEDRLRKAGFSAVHVALEEAPTSFVDEASYRAFVTTVIFHTHLARLPDATLRARFIDEVTACAAGEDPPFTLDYWRLNLEGRRP